MPAQILKIVRKVLRPIARLVYRQRKPGPCCRKFSRLYCGIECRIFLADGDKPVQRFWHSPLHKVAMGLIEMKVYRAGNYLEHLVPLGVRGKWILGGTF